MDNPNIIFILADNLGYGDIGCFGSVQHRTPFIDGMAGEGIRLTSMYSSSGVSTPSRASLMTGCYAQRVDMHLNADMGWVLTPISAKGLNPSEITIPEILRTVGYATACIGKWHLGDQKEFLPLNHGFDFFFGLPYSEDMVPSKNNPGWPDLPLMRDNEVIEAPADLTTTTQRYVDEAVKFIKKNKKRPFFLYLPHNLPGSRAVPVTGIKFSGKSANGSYGDAIEELDWAVGEIVQAVSELKLDERTMIIFTSDNGSPKGRAGSSGSGSNEPFGGAGYSTMEGGMRVPCIVKWKNKIPAGVSTNVLCTMMDWLPTFAAISGAVTYNERIIDGKNIWPVITGEKNAGTPHEVFCYYLMDQLQAVRDARWKLHLPLDNKYDSGNKNRFYGSSNLKLIDLNTDFKEETDLSGEYPEVVERLLKSAEKIRGELGDVNKKGSQIRPALYINDPEPLIMK
jgi:arylsulfatase A-like enzyme